MAITALTDYDVLTSGNTIYNDQKARWLYLYRSYVGGKEYRDNGYLTRYQLETDQEYRARCLATPLDNHCRSIISTYNSFLFRTSPVRNYGDLKDTPELEDFLKDADFEGRSFDQFMKEVSTWSLVFGHSWIIVSKPNINAITRADELEQGLRPYVSILTPLTVLDWAFTRSATGRYELSYLKYVEEVNGSVQVVKEWTQDTITTTTIDAEHKVVSETVMEENQLGRIPAVICYSDRSVIRGIGVSAIDDIADQQRFIYNCLSEADQSIRLDSHPSLVVTPDTQVGTGAGAIINMPENLDPGLKPYVLDFAGASIDAIYTVINNTISAIEKAANIGSVRATETKSLSGVAMETEFQLLNAKLSSLAQNLELAEEGIWRLFALYQGYEYDVEITYPQAFSIRDTGREIQELKAIKEITQDPRLLKEIDLRIANLLEVDDYEAKEEDEEEMDEPFVPHIMYDPVSGRQRMAMTEADHLELAEQGWIHQGE
jgi:hypothetical protein